MKVLPHTKQAFDLLHQGSITLAQVEANGIKIDLDYLNKAIAKTQRRITRLQQRLQDDKVMKTWRKVFRNRTNITSGEQLAVVLFDHLGFESQAQTATGKHKSDEASLGTVDLPIVKTFLKIKKLQKAEGTYLQGILREVVDGFLHPVFNLHLVKTFRSSSDSPNFQNLPIRNPEFAKLIRRAFIARPGRRLIEIDYGGLEVCIAACYHCDPKLLAFLFDKTTDMHRDMAAKCYALPTKEVTKLIRYCGKNMFVFPEFYGSYWLDCARSLWEACESMNLVTASGKPLRQHLTEQGFTELGDQSRKGSPREGTFEHHIQKLEKWLWEEMFPVYAQWKKDWFASYQKNGWLQMKTGFICQGFIKRNEVINYPVQGAAFHCLLQSLIWLQEEITKRRMKTKLVGQIHDSIVADVPEDEVDLFLQLAYKIMVERLTGAWKWINTPLEIEAEVTPVGGSWFEKEEWV